MNTPFDMQSSFYVEIGRIAKERDEWRKVADELAAMIDNIVTREPSCDEPRPLTKFKELEKKYPL